MSDKIKKCPLRKDAPKTIKAQYDPNKVLPMACPICGREGCPNKLCVYNGKKPLKSLYYYSCYACNKPEAIVLRHTEEDAIAAWNNWVKKYLEAQKEGGE